MATTSAQRQKKYRLAQKAKGNRILGSTYISKEAGEILDSYKGVMTIGQVISAALIALGPNTSKKL